MLTKNEIILEIEKSGLPCKEIWLGFGAALVFHGFKKETNDIDCGCTATLFNQLLNKGFKEKVSPMGNRMIEFNDYISLFLEENKPNTIVSLNYEYETIGSIIDSKIQRGREKDIKDIQSIANRLSSDLLRKKKKESSDLLRKKNKELSDLIDKMWDDDE